MNWAEDFKKVEFSITTFCQAKCPLCPRTITLASDTPEELTLMHLPLSDFKKFLNEISSNLPNVDTIELCGDYGDPFIHPQIFEIIKLAIQSGYRVDISTNGGFYQPKTFEELAKTYGKELNIGFSIDGFTKETHQKYRINVDFDLAFENMLAFNRFNPQGAIWHFILFTYNIHEIDSAFRLSQEEKLGLKFIINKRAWPYTLDELTAQQTIKKIKNLSPKILIKA